VVGAEKKRTSGVIIWMAYSEDRSGSHDFSWGGRRCQDLIWDAQVTGCRCGYW
jgi:hypothetical protein